MNAARSAGYSHNTAKKDGKRIENLAKLGLSDAFEQAGLTDKAIIAYALEGLEAIKLQSINFKIHEVPDWTIRHKYLESIAKMTGRLKEKDININNNTKVNVFPKRTVVFTGIDDLNKTDIQDVYATEGEESSRF